LLRLFSVSQSRSEPDYDSGRELLNVEDTPEAEDNAKLAAAAPELLEALIGTMKALQRVLDKYNPDDIEYEWVGEANEAIIKAIGNNIKSNTYES